MVSVLVLDTMNECEPQTAESTFESFDHATYGVLELVVMKGNMLYMNLLRKWMEKDGSESFSVSHACPAPCPCGSVVTLSYVAD